MMWLIFSICASVFQTIRNGAQRGLMKSAGLWPATWVRFAFAIPFTLLAFVVFWAARNFAPFHLSLAFWQGIFLGSITQILATSALLLAMRFSGFAIGAALQHLGIIVSAIFGMVFLDDKITFWGWNGLILVVIGMLIVSWPKQEKAATANFDTIWGAIFGTLCGISLAICTNAFRFAVINVEGHANMFSGILAVLITQVLQSFFMGIILIFSHNHGMREIKKRWKESLNAGWGGSIASILWFVALGLAPAALVKAANLVVEIPISVFWGAYKFKEKIAMSKLLAILLIIAGVVITLIASQL